MSGMLANIILIVLLVAIVGCAVWYFTKRRKEAYIVLDARQQDPVHAHVCQAKRNL